MCRVQAAVVEYRVGGGTISEVELGRSPSWGMQVMQQEVPWRHAWVVPDARKDRLNGRKSRQQTGERPPYHSP
jgi:hypothetical protein